MAREFLITKDCCCSYGKPLENHVTIQVQDELIACPYCNEMTGYLSIAPEYNLNLSWDHPRNFPGLGYVVCLKMGGIEPAPPPAAPRKTRMIRLFDYTPTRTFHRQVLVSINSVYRFPQP